MPAGVHKGVPEYKEHLAMSTVVTMASALSTTDDEEKQNDDAHN